jgi:hypothetical protein
MMRTFRILAAVVLGAGLAAGSVAGTGIADAAGPTPTVFINIKVSPNYITYGHTTLTVTGMLVESADHSVGVPGELVDINARGAEVTVATATTNSTGFFSVAESGLTWQDQLVAVTAGDATYGAATSAPVDVTVLPAPTRVTLNKQAQLVAPAGTVRTFTGRAQVEVNGKWIPLPGASVQVTQNNGLTLPPNGPTGITKPDGTFSLQAQAISSGGHWFAATIYPWPPPASGEPDPLYSTVNSNEVNAYISYRTRITKFSIPARTEGHHGLDINGVMQLWEGNKWGGPDAVANPTVWMRRLPAGRWNGVLQFQAGPSGNNALTFGIDGVILNDGRGIAPGKYEWRVQQQYSDDLSLYYAVFRASAPVDIVTTIVDNTCITNLTVTHTNGRTQVAGEVQDSCASWETSFGPVKGTYKVYFHPRGTTKWRLLGSALTSSRGGLSFTHAGILNGYFKVLFPAQWYYLGSTSKSVYVHS